MPPAPVATTDAPPSDLVEARGIEYIPASERWGHPSRLFWLWAGTVWNVEFLVYGTLAVGALGLSFAQAVPIIVLGNLTYFFTGWASLPGPAAGTTALTVSRAPFGARGNRPLSLFNWLTQVGFEIEGIALIVLIAVAMITRAGGKVGTGLEIVLIVLAVLVQAVLPFAGHAAILRLLKWLAYPFIALFVVMAALTAGKVDLHAQAHGASWGTLMVFLALVISTGGLGWTENASDFSRYLPENTSRKRVVFAVALGAAIPSVLLEILGAALATAVPAANASTVISVTGLARVFPSWFVWPYFAMAIVQLFAINSLDLYSSGVTLQSLGIPLRRYQCVLIDSVVCGGFTAYAIFSSRFNTLLQDFVLFIIVWLAPWFAIFMTDYLLRGKRYDSASLFASKGGTYWRKGGFHWPAIVAQAVGMAAAALWLNAYSPYVSPLSRLLDGSDFSVFMGLIFGGGTYWLLARRGVRREAGLAGLGGAG